MEGCRASNFFQHRNLKERNFVESVISKVVGDLTFSRNEPLKSDEDKKIGSLKNKIRTQKVLNELKRTKIRLMTEIECVVEGLFTFIDVKTQFANNFQVRVTVHH